MKLLSREMFSGFTVAISFTLVVEWMQLLLLILGIISALIPVVKTIQDVIKGKKKVDELIKDLADAQTEIKYYHQIYQEKEEESKNE